MHIAKTKTHTHTHAGSRVSYHQRARGKWMRLPTRCERGREKFRMNARRLMMPGFLTKFYAAIQYCRLRSTGALRRTSVWMWQSITIHSWGVRARVETTGERGSRPQLRFRWIVRPNQFPFVHKVVHRPSGIPQTASTSRRRDGSYWFVNLEFAMTWVILSDEHGRMTEWAWVCKMSRGTIPGDTMLVEVYWDERWRPLTSIEIFPFLHESSGGVGPGWWLSRDMVRPLHLRVQTPKSKPWANEPSPMV